MNVDDNVEGNSNIQWASGYLSETIRFQPSAA